MWSDHTNSKLTDQHWLKSLEKCLGIIQLTMGYEFVVQLRQRAADCDSGNATFQHILVQICWPFMSNISTSDLKTQTCVEKSIVLSQIITVFAINFSTECTAYNIMQEWCCWIYTSGPLFSPVFGFCRATAVRSPPSPLVSSGCVVAKEQLKSHFKIALSLLYKLIRQNLNQLAVPPGFSCLGGGIMFSKVRSASILFSTLFVVPYRTWPNVRKCIPMF